jgi:hypothetical protein
MCGDEGSDCFSKRWIVADHDKIAQAAVHSGAVEFRQAEPFQAQRYQLALAWLAAVTLVATRLLSPHLSRNRVTVIPHTSSRRWQL